MNTYMCNGALQLLNGSVFVRYKYYGKGKKVLHGIA